MTLTHEGESLLLPEDARLIYIGPPKTGTTSLQEAASSARDVLYENGVYYPGKGRNHRSAITSLLKQPDPLTKHVAGQLMQPGSNRTAASRVQPATTWRKLMDDVEAEPSKRVLISHEFAATASREEVERVREELGQERIHVAITLRPLWAIFPSRWIETLKNGVSSSLSFWLERYYDPTDETIPTRTRRYLDHAELVERWADVVGAENVTVIVVDKSHRDILTDTFERMLGLPERTLTGAVTGGVRTNRSMSRLEADVIREVNEAVYHPGKTSWPLYLDVVYLGAINHLLDSRVPPASEPRVEMPEWAIEKAVQESSQVADRVAASGVRVVGDLDHLRSHPPKVSDDIPTDPDAIHQIAVEALSGAVTGALKYEKDLLRQARKQAKQGSRKTEGAKKAQASAPKPEPVAPGVEHKAVKQVTSRELIGVLANRTRKRVGRRIGVKK